MKKALIDVPVLLIFFTRPDSFKQVFDKVKQARPSKLFLACDGPREHKYESDKEKISECKKIAEDIDWECEVYKNYSETNMGCGMKPQTSIAWALSIVDRVVILEDDCVPELTFFQYMADLLEKYKYDERICMVSGLNHFKDWDCGGYSYGFSKCAAIWGWGTWKRVWDSYDYSLSVISDSYVQKLLRNTILFKNTRKGRMSYWINTAKKVSAGENISYWDSQFGFVKFYQGQLGIFPKHNLIYNTGVGNDSTHAKVHTKNVWHKGMLHFIPIQPMTFPLKCPDFVICDNIYDKKYEKNWGHQGFFKKNMGRIKRLIKTMLFKN